MAKRTFDKKEFKPRVSFLVAEKIDYIDYKNVDLLRRFLSDRGKIRSRDVTGNTVQQQKQVSKAIKVAREMALLPYQVISTNTKGKRKPRYSKSDENDTRSDKYEGKSESKAPEAKVEAPKEAAPVVKNESEKEG